MQDDSLPARLSEFMRLNHLSQEAVADAASVSQSSVSRALKRVSKRHGKATTKLFTYMQQQSAAGFAGRGTDKVVEAFESIWDGSDEHAMAIARIIKASGGLLPEGHSREGE
jgi:hypothetical protein